MRIDVVSDTICPWCFIGKRRLERALAERPQADVKIGWRPFQLNPDMPSGGMERSAYLDRKFGGTEAARHVYDPIHAAGKAEGIPFAFGRIARTPNTVNSHRLIGRAAADGLQDAVVEALFRAYFLDGKDIESPASLALIAGSAGMDADAARAYLEGDEDADRVRAEDMQARQLGIQGVPFFIIERKYAISGAQDPAVFQRAFELAGAASGEPAPLQP